MSAGIDLNEVINLRYSAQLRVLKEEFGSPLNRTCIKIESPDGKRIDFFRVNGMYPDHLARALENEFGALAHSGRLRVVSTQTRQAKNSPKSTSMEQPAPAAQILRAGAKARGEIVEDHSAPTGVAAQILRAGAKARGERI
jgi:hypothetical protein